MPPRRHPARRRTIAGIAVIVVVGALGAGVAIAVTRSGGRAYRTATVTRAAVAQTLDGTGTIEAVSQATAAFPTSGTVATVDVHIGSPVTAGETLATLQSGPLEQAVLQQQASLAQAKVTLQKALDAQSSASTTSSTSSSASASGGSGSGGVGGTGGTSGGGTSGSTGSLAAIQQRVVAGQHSVDVDVATTQRMEHAAEQACGADHPHPGTTTTTSGGTTTTTSGGSTTTTTAPGNPTGPGSNACIGAQEALLSAEQSLARAEQALARDETALARLLSSASRTGTGATKSPASTARTNSSAASGLGSTHVPTAMDIAADQAAIDAQQAAVTAAVENLQQATLASPINGVVGALSITPGASVSAGSSSATVTVVGRGGYEVATTVTVDDIANVKLGESAQVVADGTSTSLPGKVVYIGTADLSSSSATYPVVIGLADPNPNVGLRDGATATTSIEVARATTSALTVPTSAVQSVNGRHTVDVLAGAKVSTVSVEVGVVGPIRTQIVSGLRAGQIVVLADLHQAIPSSNVANALTRNGTGGLLGGGGGGGGLGGGGGGRARPGG